MHSFENYDILFYARQLLLGMYFQKIQNSKNTSIFECHNLSLFRNIIEQRKPPNEQWLQQQFIKALQYQRSLIAFP